MQATLKETTHGKEIVFPGAVLDAVVDNILASGLQARLNQETVPADATTNTPASIPTVSALFHKFVAWVAEHSQQPFDSAKLRILRDVWSPTAPEWERLLAVDPLGAQRIEKERKSDAEAIGRTDGSPTFVPPVISPGTSDKDRWAKWKQSLTKFMNQLPAQTCNGGSSVYNM